jgi:hypothetical protein
MPQKAYGLEIERYIKREVRGAYSGTTTVMLIGLEFLKT